MSLVLAMLVGMALVGRAQQHMLLEEVLVSQRGERKGEAVGKGGRCGRGAVLCGWQGEAGGVGRVAVRAMCG
jgi:hypothetical protein